MISGPSIPSLPHHDNSTDEIFANSSTETVIENIDFSLILQEGFEFTCKQPDLKPTGLGSGGQITVAIDEQNPMAQNVHNYSLLVCSRDISVVANELVSEAASFPQKLYCPFCIYHFSWEYLLKDHIKSIHEHELNKILNPLHNEFTFNPCPFCHAKFYLKGLVCKHVMHYHQNDVINIFQCASPDSYTTCIFCSHKVLKKHEKLLLIHIEKKHANELQNFIEHKLSEVVLPTGQCSQASQPEIGDLLSQINSKPVSSISETSTLPHNNPKSILKNRDVKYICNDDQNVQDRYGSSDQKSILVRRGLNFENTERDQRDADKENNRLSDVKKVDKHGIIKPEVRKRKRKTWKSLFSFKRHNVPEIQIEIHASESKQCKTDMLEQGPGIKVIKPKFVCSTPVSLNCNNRNTDISFGMSPCRASSPVKRVMFKSVLDDDGVQPIYDKMDVDYCDGTSVVKQFQCALCDEAYVDNVDLLRHTRKFHRGPKNLFHPLYRCGECEAKFYKNSYLVRHCQFHHTPLCLRNRNKIK